MKKTAYNLTSILAIAAVTTLVACKKDIPGPENDLPGRHKVIPAAQSIISPATARTNYYIGFPDSFYVRK